MSADNAGPSRAATAIWLRQDFAGGLVIIGVAIFAFWQASDLPVGTLGGMGPGMLPKSLAVLLALLGALLLRERTCLDAGPPLGRWSIRGPLLVLGGVVVFGLTRTSAGASRRRTARDRRCGVRQRRIALGRDASVRRRDDGVLHRAVQVRSRASRSRLRPGSSAIELRHARSHRQSRARVRNGIDADQSAALLHRRASSER